MEWFSGYILGGNQIQGLMYCMLPFMYEEETKKRGEEEEERQEKSEAKTTETDYLWEMRK